MTRAQELHLARQGLAAPRVLQQLDRERIKSALEGPAGTLSLAAGCAWEARRGTFRQSGLWRAWKSREQVRRGVFSASPSIASQFDWDIVPSLATVSSRGRVWEESFFTKGEAGIRRLARLSELSVSVVGAHIASTAVLYPPIVSQRAQIVGTVQVVDEGHSHGFEWLESRRLRLDEPAKEQSVASPPYAALIRGLIESEQTVAARKLLAIALRETPAPEDLAALQRVLEPPRVVASKKLDVDRAKEYRWLTAHAREFTGQWVALVGERMVARAGSLKALLASLKEEGPETPPLIYRIAD